MRNALDRRLARRRRRRACSATSSSSARTPSPRTRWPTSVSPARPARSSSARRSPSAWPSSASPAACRSGSRPRVADREMATGTHPGVRHRRSACCSPRSPAQSRHRRRRCCSATCWPSPANSWWSSASSRPAGAHARRPRPAAGVRVGEPGRSPRRAGCPVRALGLAFIVLLALTITMAVQVVGTLLLFALVVTPAATALRLTARRPRRGARRRPWRSARCGAGWCSRRCSTCRRASSSSRWPCWPG